MKTRTLIKNLRHRSLHYRLKGAYMNFWHYGLYIKRATLVQKIYGKYSIFIYFEM